MSTGISITIGRCRMIINPWTAASDMDLSKLRKLLRFVYQDGAEFDKLQEIFTVIPKIRTTNDIAVMDAQRRLEDEYKDPKTVPKDQRDRVKENNKDLRKAAADAKRRRDAFKKRIPKLEEIRDLYYPDAGKS